MPHPYSPLNARLKAGSLTSRVWRGSLKALMEDFMGRGGTIVACPPCVKARGYTQEDFIDGVQVAGASVVHEKLMAGAASLPF